MENEIVVIFKDKKSRQIQTYVNLSGHGAKVSIEDFLKLVCEAYGSPATTIKRQTHLEKILDASQVVIREMKIKTREVAAINMEPSVKK